MTRSRLTVISVAVIAITIAFAGIAGAQARLFSSDRSDQIRELNASLGMKVAAFPSQPGRPDRNVYVAVLSNGAICVNAGTTDRKSWSGGCNPGRTPLGGKPFMLMFSYNGGPTVDTVKEARLYGLADSSVATLEAVMSDGSTRPLRLSAGLVAATPFRVFADRVSPQDLRAGVTPVAVVAYDALGVELARQATGLT